MEEGFWRSMKPVYADPCGTGGCRSWSLSWRLCELKTIEIYRNLLKSCKSMQMFCLSFLTSQLHVHQTIPSQLSVWCKMMQVELKLGVVPGRPRETCKSAISLVRHTGDYLPLSPHLEVSWCFTEWPLSPGSGHVRNAGTRCLRHLCKEGGASWVCALQIGQQ